MIVIIMGVAGSGKSTVSKVLAKHLRWQYRDADAYHSPENIAKMSSGIGLTDEDRRPWLDAMRNDIQHWIATKQNFVLACSALKCSYRDILLVGEEEQAFVYLKGTPELFATRLARRKTHFMKQNMLESQFEALEEPSSSEAIICDARESIKEIVLKIEQALKRLNK
jgi:gluconokinase